MRVIRSQIPQLIFLLPEQVLDSHVGVHGNSTLLCTHQASVFGLSSMTACSNELFISWLRMIMVDVACEGAHWCVCLALPELHGLPAVGSRLDQA